jgi:hypothetical protein|eukprot:COSAG01_NODE_1106_length_11666_cov_5.510504_6_plen_62_part_00
MHSPSNRGGMRAGCARRLPDWGAFRVWHLLGAPGGSTVRLLCGAGAGTNGSQASLTGISVP